MAGISVSEERFEELVADALDSIPLDLADEMENVVVIVEDWPTAQQLEGRRGTLLGLYQGIDLPRRSPSSYSGAMPDQITIFKRPLERIASDEDDLARQVRVTVLHEVGHHFGLSDARLHELGWA